jgi:hypothetical protein
MFKLSISFSTASLDDRLKMLRNLKYILVVVSVCIVLSGCMLFDFLYDPPGKGPTAEAWYKRSQPIIESLENYKANNHRYPDALTDLLPTYASVVSEKELKQGMLQYLQYQRQDDGYELTFTYYRPGVNICVFRPNSKWECKGYY